MQCVISESDARIWRETVGTFVETVGMSRRTSQLLNYLSSSKLLPRLQNAYGTHHSKADSSPESADLNLMYCRSL